MVTWRDVYSATAKRLGSETDARWLVEAAAADRWPRLLDDPVTMRAATWVEERVGRLLAGEPLQYVLGRWAFRGLDLVVDPRVLIPRPETEQVVDVALTELRRLLADRTPVFGTVVDLGTGSGAIGLSIAAEQRRVSVWATDVSRDALNVARANLAGLGGWAGTRVRLAEGSWWDALPPGLAGKVDLVVSNPPYVSTAEMDYLDARVAGWEPRLALEAGTTGLEQVRAILDDAPLWLGPGGVAVIEIAPHQSDRAANLAVDAGLVGVTVRKDLAGRDRVLVACRPQ